MPDVSRNIITKENSLQSPAGAVSEELNTTDNSKDQGKTSGNNASTQKEINKNNNTKTTEPTKVIIARNSMIKHLKGFRMSTKETRVQIAIFPGATTLDITDHIKPIQRKRPDKLILHVGTNNLGGRRNPNKHAEEIMSLIWTN